MVIRDVGFSGLNQVSDLDGMLDTKIAGISLPYILGGVMVLGSIFIFLSKKRRGRR